LEPHFVGKLLELAGIVQTASPSRDPMLRPGTKTQLAAYFAKLTRQQLNALARQHDLPLMSLPPIRQ
jgi:hypothetical protein